MTVLLRRMQVDATVHGFSSAFRDWAGECSAFTHEVCKVALAHTISNKVEVAYRRGDLLDKRRRLMANWATYCATTGAAGAMLHRFGRRKHRGAFRNPAAIPLGPPAIQTTQIQFRTWGRWIESQCLRLWGPPVIRDNIANTGFLARAQMVRYKARVAKS